MPLMKFLSFQLIPIWNCLLFMECFLCDIVFCHAQTMYIQFMNILSSMMYQFILNLTKQHFPFWNFLFNNDQDFYQNVNNE